MRCYTVAARQRGSKASNLLYKLSLARIAANRQHGWIAVEYGITALFIYLFIVVWPMFYGYSTKRNDIQMYFYYVIVPLTRKTMENDGTEYGKKMVAKLLPGTGTRWSVLPNGTQMTQYYGHRKGHGRRSPEVTIYSDRPLTERRLNSKFGKKHQRKS